MNTLTNPCCALLFWGLCWLVACPAKAQLNPEKRFYDNGYCEVDSSRAAYYTVSVYKDSLKRYMTRKRYKMASNLLCEQQDYDVTTQKEHGIYLKFGMDGRQVITVGRYVQGSFEGEWVDYYSDGLLASRRYYQQNELVREVCFDRKQQETDCKSTKIDYDGGLKEFYVLIRDELVMPRAMRKHLMKVPGERMRLFVELDCDEKGYVTKFVLIDISCSGLDLGEVEASLAKVFAKTNGKWIAPPDMPLADRKIVLPIVFALN